MKNLFKKILIPVLVLSMLVGLLIPAAAAQITAGQALSVTVVDDETPVVFRFVPTKTGYYTFYSYNSEDWDPSGYIMDGDGELLAQGDDTENGLDFSMDCYMVAGKTYSLAATCYSGSATYTVQIDLLPSPTSMEFDRATYTGGIRDTLSPQVLFSPKGCAQESITRGGRRSLSGHSRHCHRHRHLPQRPACHLHRHRGGTGGTCFGYPLDHGCHR